MGQCRSFWQALHEQLFPGLQNIHTGYKWKHPHTLTVAQDLQTTSKDFAFTHKKLRAKAKSTRQSSLPDQYTPECTDVPCSYTHS